MTKYEVQYYVRGDQSPIRKFLDELPPKAAAKCLKYIDFHAERGFSLPRNYCAKVEGDIWELRPAYGNVEYRLLFAWIEGRFFVIAHAMVKMGRKLPPADIAIAEKRAREVQAYHAGSDQPEPRPVHR